MKTITKLLSVTIIILLFVSCASSPSLQKYYIDNQDDKNFVSLDLPASLVSLKDNASPEAQQTLESIKKLNVLAFVKNESNEAEYALENTKVKTIIKDNKYVELVRVKDKGRNIVVKYEGNEDDDTIDELIVYANDKSQGFALVRVLGNKMEPGKILKMMNEIGDIDGDSFKGLKDLAKNIK
ncbi:DUF4252 domain-containing protein [Aureibaculum sp. 2210JD6-5]|uniref:DUF4252 domain-containing protein n=1 Tax=Aureibaculum sp. 2210JD6-5 TaxID=3103957 RepID=UPI002AAD845F|nr:DUF4252 domain-containing protein [Aureibaculum sp. 2210JD6-5]MDY7394031.1 DUF4252 domain-containing protein [Aureibaculum sp. 2210JD6-5]